MQPKRRPHTPWQPRTTSSKTPGAFNGILDHLGGNNMMEWQKNEKVKAFSTSVCGTKLIHQTISILLGNNNFFR